MHLHWFLFIALILLLLSLDLGVFHRKSHVISFKEALGWSAMWITLGLSFSIVVWFAYDAQWNGLGIAPDPVDGHPLDGRQAVLKYLTGYVIEESLSIDNIFVIAMIIGSLGVPALYQHKLLFWGILGALVLRGTMIGLGTALIARFHWVLLVFGAFLVLTGFKMLVSKGAEIDPDRSRLVRFLRRFLPVTSRYHGGRFLVRAGSPAAAEPAEPGAPRANDPAVAAQPAGTLMLTPLAVALALIEFTDLIFAVDSIPAIFAITADPFIVYTSNVFAILGLRSLYFALAGMIREFRHLKPALSAVLVLIGVKMLFAKQLKSLVGPDFNLYVLLLVLILIASGVIFSLRDRNR